MTFAQICKLHVAGKPLHFTHPDLMGVYTFGDDGELTYSINEREVHGNFPMWLSDFDRDDWYTL